MDNFSGLIGRVVLGKSIYNGASIKGTVVGAYTKKRGNLFLLSGDQKTDLILVVMDARGKIEELRVRDAQVIAKDI